MKTVIIDCDPGNGIPGANVDDGLALALALRSPECTLAAITTVSGNTHSYAGHAIAEQIVTAAEAAVPVYAGATRALIEQAPSWQEHMARKSDAELLEELWAGIPEPTNISNPPQRAVTELVRIVDENPGEVTVVALGPLTNIALAMRLSDTFSKNVAGITVMGGVFGVDGYIADTNFGLDPEAARIVLCSGADLTLIPLDVTTTTMLTQDDLARISRSCDPLAKFIARTSAPWIEYSQRVRKLPGMWVHDAVAVASALDAEFLTYRNYLVDIELSGISRGRTLKWPAFPVPGQAHSHGPERFPVQVAETVDNAALVQLLTTCIGAV